MNVSIISENVCLHLILAILNIEYNEKNGKYAFPFYAWNDRKELNTLPRSCFAFFRSISWGLFGHPAKLSQCNPWNTKDSHEKKEYKKVHIKIKSDETALLFDNDTFLESCGCPN